MIERLAALEQSSQELLRGQREMRRDVRCVVQTWSEFQGTYGEHLKLSLARDRERAALRRAIIEKTLSGALWAIIAFLAVSAYHEAVQLFQVALK